MQTITASTTDTVRPVLFGKSYHFSSSGSCCAFTFDGEVFHDAKSYE